MTRSIRSHAFSFTLLGCALVAGLSSGCKKAEFKMGTASGSCTCNGEPMTAGLLVFTPIRDPEAHGKKLELGKPAHGMIQRDGSFTLSTFGKEDGAVIGKHRVVLNLGVLEDGDPQQPCKTARQDLVVEIAPGDNKLAIELAEPRAKRK